MKHYLKYSALDLSLDQDFIDWVRHGKNDALWKSLTQGHSSFNLTVREARSLVESLQMRPVSKEQVDVEMEINVLLNKISIGESTHSVHPEIQLKPKKLPGILLLLGAVAAVLLIWIGTWQTTESDFIINYETLTAAKKLVEHTNSTDSNIHFELPDKSSISLSPGSRFSYAAGFNDSANRDVYLLGEAFFEVSKNTKKPFRVFTNDLITRVLGTSFTIRAYENEKDVNVIVQTGKVNVYHEKSEGVLLTANQQVVYQREQKKIIKQLKENPVIINHKIKINQLVFDDQPVLEVLMLLKEAYGIEINYDSELLTNCTITADLTNESIFKKLDLICRAINADYEVINSEVYIYPKGCN